MNSIIFIWNPGNSGGRLELVSGGEVDLVGGLKKVGRDRKFRQRNISLCTPENDSLPVLGRTILACLKKLESSLIPKKFRVRL